MSDGGAALRARIVDAIPAPWAAAVSRLEPDGGPSGAQWVRELPAVVADSLDRWNLTLAGPALTGWTALVLPVTRSGEPLMLKTVWPHREARGEPLALRLWDGQAAVRLVAADPAHGALLLERLDHRRTLAGPEVADDDAMGIAGDLLRRLHRDAVPQLLTVEDYLAPALRRIADEPRVPGRVRSRVAGLAREVLRGDGANATLPDGHRPVILHGDLHLDNVLAGEREPWLTIDPKPVTGHPGFELQPLLRSRAGDLGTGASLRWQVRRRLDIACEAMGIDVEVGRAWAVLMSGLEMLWSADRPADASFHHRLLKALDD